MADDAKPKISLHTLDAMHDDVLMRLEELNARLEATLAQFAPQRAPKVPASTPVQPLERAA